MSGKQGIWTRPIAVDASGEVLAAALGDLGLAVHAVQVETLEDNGRQWTVTFANQVGDMLGVR